MRIKMTLLSDAVFGNGRSIPGQEDISVLFDEKGFPYLKGSTWKGIFREELNNILLWNGRSEKEADGILTELLGCSGDTRISDDGKIRFSDLRIPDGVRAAVLSQEGIDPEETKEAFSYIRTFTAIDVNGMTKAGSLRNCRCLKKGLVFYGEVDCPKESWQMVEDVLGLIKWAGTLRSRGFGKVKMECVKEGK